MTKSFTYNQDLHGFVREIASKDAHTHPKNVSGKNAPGQTSEEDLMLNLSNLPLHRITFALYGLERYGVLTKELHDDLLAWVRLWEVQPKPMSGLVYGLTLTETSVQVSLGNGSTYQTSVVRADREVLRTKLLTTSRYGRSPTVPEDASPNLMTFPGKVTQWFHNGVRSLRKKEKVSSSLRDEPFICQCKWSYRIGINLVYGPIFEDGDESCAHMMSKADFAEYYGDCYTYWRSKS